VDGRVVDNSDNLWMVDELRMCVLRLATREKRDPSWITPLRMTATEVREEYLYTLELTDRLESYIRDLELKALKDG